MSMLKELNKEFWKYGEGAMCWTTLQTKEGELHKALFVKLPNDRSISFVIYPMHEENNWSQPGTKNGWNGDEERPTFKPSIGGKTWHGYITHGELTTKSCDMECCDVAQ